MLRRVYKEIFCIKVTQSVITDSGNRVCTRISMSWVCSHGSFSLKYLNEAQDAYQLTPHIVKMVSTHTLIRWKTWMKTGTSLSSHPYLFIAHLLRALREPTRVPPRGIEPARESSSSFESPGYWMYITLLLHIRVLVPSPYTDTESYVEFNHDH